MTSPAATDPLIHSAAYYTSDEDYVGLVLPFLFDGLTAGDPVLVMAPSHRIEMLTARLGRSANRVTFLDMTVGLRNPARIIPASRRFAEGYPGRRVRVMGDPIWPGRSAAELREVVRHEACVNILFAGADATILCPYDASSGAAVLRDADRTHPLHFEGGEYRSSANYVDPDDVLSTQDPLPAAPSHAERMDFHHGDLASVRRVVKDRGDRVGLSKGRVRDLRLAVNEVATNTLTHGSGAGTLRIWWDTDTIVCEVSDHGVITDPLVGRLPPPANAEAGRGLWIVNQLCDLAEIRSGADGTTIRMHVRVG